MNTRRSSRAFSLLEILVAMTVSSILLAVVLLILSASLDTWRYAESYRLQHKAANTLFGTIESDLFAAIIRPTLPSDEMVNIPWLKVESVAFRDGSSSRLSLLSLVADQSPDWKGDICLVQYGLATRETRDGANVMLFRELRDPMATSTSGDWGTIPFVDPDTFGPASVVAANFVQFQIGLEVTSEDGTIQVIPATQSPSVSHDGDVSWEGSTGRHRLLAVHVTTEIVSRSGMNVFVDRGYESVPEKDKRSFFLRVAIGDGRS